MKRLFKLLPVIAAMAFTVTAQDEDNLVTNGSFESIKGKVRGLGSIKAAEGWVSPTGVSADLFVDNAKLAEIQTPKNAYGTEEAKDGYNYAGIIVYSYNDKMRRTYIMTKLASPMKKGSRYKVEFNASLAELSKYSSNKLAAHFSKKEFGTDEKVNALIEESHVLHPKEEVFNGMYNWDRVCGEYTAKGGEKYMTIGNFTNNNDVKTAKSKKPKSMKGTQIIAAYYYIDNVSVTLIEADQACECDYEDAAETGSSMVYQRTSVATREMSEKDKVNQDVIFYGYGKSDLSMSSDKVLKEVAAYMVANPTAVLEISGHMDTQEVANSAGGVNTELANISQTRLEYVRSQLINYNVDISKIKLVNKKATTAYAEINDYDDDELKQAKNRRVEFTIL